MIYLHLILMAVVTVYVVDVSGFTDSWRNALQRILPPGQRLGSLRPFDCGTCMTWWTCVAFSAIKGELSLLTVVVSAMLSLMAVPIGELLILFREGTSSLLRKIIDKL